MQPAVGAVGRVIATVDPTGRRTASAYDDRDRPTTTTDALGGVTTATYDPADNLLSLSDARSQVTSFTYMEGIDPSATLDAPGLDDDVLVKECR